MAARELIRLMSLSARFGACVGLGIGIVVLFYGRRMSDSALLLLCPPSIVGIGLDNAPPVVGTVIVASAMTIGNAIWYAVLFGLAGMGLKKSRIPRGPGAH